MAAAAAVAAAAAAAAAVAAVVVDDVPAATAVYAASDTDVAVGKMSAVFAVKPAGVASDGGVLLGMLLLGMLLLMCGGWVDWLLHQWWRSCNSRLLISGGHLVWLLLLLLLLLGVLSRWGGGPGCLTVLIVVLSNVA